MAKVLQQYILIVHENQLKALDRTMQGLRNNRNQFGGTVILLAGSNGHYSTINVFGGVQTYGPSISAVVLVLVVDDIIGNAISISCSFLNNVKKPGQNVGKLNDYLGL